MFPTVISSPWWLVVKVFKIVFFLDTSEQRISRWQYWIATGMLALADSLFNLFGSFLWDSIFLSWVTTTISAWLGFLWLSIMIKRLQDLNMSKWWISPFVVFYFTLFIGLIVFLFPKFAWWEFNLDLFQNLASSVYWMIWIGIYGIVWLIALIISFRLSFNKSVNENNKFWPDPLRNITVGNIYYWLIVIVLVVCSSVLGELNKKDTSLTPEEQQELQQYLDEYNTNEWTWSVDTNDDEGGILDRLSGVQERAKDVAKSADLQQISTALQTYQLDNNTYPIYDSFVDVSQLSSFLIWWKNEYLKSMPITDWSIYYYKSFEQDTWFILMVEMSPGARMANFFWSQSDIDNKSLTEIKNIIENPIKNDWTPRYIVTN